MYIEFIHLSTFTRSMCKDLAQRRERERERERASLGAVYKTAPSEKLTIYLSLTTKMLRGQNSGIYRLVSALCLWCTERV